MRNRFDQQLHHLDEQLTHMGELCEIAISKVTQALKEGSAGQARIVVAEDEEIDQMEKEIERLCLKLLLQQQPVAKDLRRISAAISYLYTSRYKDYETALYKYAGDGTEQTERLFTDIIEKEAAKKRLLPLKEES